MLVSLQNMFVDCNASASHIPISSVNLDLFGVLVNHFPFLFLCLVRSHLQTGGLTNGYYSVNH